MDWLYSAFYWLMIVITLVLLGVIAWRDWKTQLIHLADNLYLVIAATALLVMGGDWKWTLISALITAILGFGIVVAKIIYDTRRNKPLSLHLGDAILFASTGFLLGPLGMAMAFIINVPFYFAHHFWLAKQEKRSIWNGYAPVAPAYCTAVSIVFGFQINQGGML